MSAGPIKQWRDAHKPARSQPQSTAVHGIGGPGRAYCGRKSRSLAPWDAVTCDDCKAAHRADTTS